ncbi:MAG: GtrA family protein, partial [Chlamydiota bacterium]
MKIKISWIQFFLYGGVGFISCCTDLIIFYLFSQVFFFQLVLSNAISFLLATTLNYILCFSFVFSRNSIPHSQELLRLLFVV